MIDAIARENEWPGTLARVITADAWYILLHGDYATAGEAATAAEEIAERLGQEPWPRPWRAIQGRLPGATIEPDGDDTLTPALREAAAWVAERDAGAGTLQLFATRDRQRAVALAAEHDEVETRVVPVRRDGNLWYHVIAGDYASPAAAEEALADSPDAVRALEPWARSFQGLQEGLPAME